MISIRNILIPLFFILVLILFSWCVITRLYKSNKNNQEKLLEKFNNSEPGVLISMLTLPQNSAGTPDTSVITLHTCTQLGSISKPDVNIMDLTLLNRKLPLNIFNAHSFITNFGIILDPEKLIPKSDPSKYVQCLRVRDSGSDLRRCDTDFNKKLKSRDHSHKTYGKYNLPLRDIKDKDCDCHYEDSISNVCNTKAEVVGCGAKCTESGKICGQVNWCDSDDFNNLNEDGLGCATHPKDIQQWIDATAEWNKKRIEEDWDIPHYENELDAYIANNKENQDLIIDSILGFVFTDMCGKESCSKDISSHIQTKMEKVTNDFNKYYDKDVSLYKLLLDTSINVGAYKNDKFVKWEDNNYTTDISSLLVNIKLDPTNVTEPTQMYTYRVAETVDGIKNRNTGDLGGDNSYISGEFCHRHSDDFCQKSIISEYKVDYLPINPKIPAKKDGDGDNCTLDQTDCVITQDGFGPYAMCNQGGKVGGEGKYACNTCGTDNIPDYLCDKYPGVEINRFNTNKWYSWPEDSYCDGKKLGTDGCTWNYEKTNHFKIGKIPNYKLLLKDSYKNITSNCSSGDKDCVTDAISTFVKTNSPSNMKALKKAFSRE